MSEPVDTASLRPGDNLVSFRFEGHPYKGVLRPGGANTWQLLAEGEWWGTLSYEIRGYRFVDVEDREQPFTLLEDFTTTAFVPTPIEELPPPIERLELHFGDDRLQYRYLVEQQPLNKNWELFVLHRGGSKFTLTSDRPFIRRTQGKSADYSLRLSDGQRAAEGFLDLLYAQLRRLIQTHFERE